MSPAGTGPWWAGAATLAVCVLSAVAGGTPGSPRQLLWGDTHLHTSYSFDAFLNSNHTADPDTAYRYARGMPVIHPYHRARVQIVTPLNFLVVSDHAEFFGAMREIYLNGLQLEDPGPLDAVRAWLAERRIRNAIDAGEGAGYFLNALPEPAPPPEAAARQAVGGGNLPEVGHLIRSSWHASAQIADRHNTPGEFTALIGWEWTALPGGANLHRVIVTDADADTATTFMPFGSDQSVYPDDLWRWLARTSETTGANFVAIPHNSNLSKGYMFPAETLRGGAIDADYARLRATWEPVVEVTQIKGDSEAHPDLSPGDPFAGFEPYPYYLQRGSEPYRARPGDFVRTALLRGLTIESAIGENPYRFGLIGSTDSHTGLSSAEEPNFWGKMATDSIPENKASHTFMGASGWTMAASGLAAVWAEANTRSAIVAAIRRRETYATTGPRIRVRVFGGWDFTAIDPGVSDIEAARLRGVPMGAMLPRRPAPGGIPGFVITALKDPVDANLDRVQVIKGWIGPTGDPEERIFDVAPDSRRDTSGALLPVGDTVDRRTGRYTNSIGSPALATVWQDPGFDPSAPAFYYVRVLQIPTPRHALFDALALGREAADEGPAVIQERAYTSPIFYQP